jgi:hypothetical protein
LVPNAEAIGIMPLVEQRQHSSSLEMRVVLKRIDFVGGVKGPGRKWVRGEGVKEENLASGRVACQGHNVEAQRHVLESGYSGEPCRQFPLRELQEPKGSSCGLKALLRVSVNPVVSHFVKKDQVNSQRWGQAATSQREGEIVGEDSKRLVNVEQTTLKYALGQLVVIEVAFEGAGEVFGIAPHMGVALEGQVLLSQ